ncbi:hypothetical protein J6590_014921 [Homalodisca vitripennis]|nr:hypothetical protein J6590_014921 [Homalodisca vitripennis]
MDPSVPVWLSIVCGISNNNEAIRQDNLSRVYQAMGRDYGAIHFIDYGYEEDNNDLFNPDDWVIPEPVSPLSDTSEDIPTNSTSGSDATSTQTNKVTPLRRDSENKSNSSVSSGHSPTSSQSALYQNNTAMERDELENTPSSSLSLNCQGVRHISSTSVFHVEHVSTRTDEVHPMRRDGKENTTISQMSNRSRDIPTISTLDFHQAHTSTLTTEVSPMRRDDTEDTHTSSNCPGDRHVNCTPVLHEEHLSTRTSEISPMRRVDTEDTHTSSNCPGDRHVNCTPVLHEEHLSTRTSEISPMRRVDTEDTHTLSNCPGDRHVNCTPVLHEEHLSTRTSEIRPMRRVHANSTPISHISNRTRRQYNTPTSLFNQESSSIRTFKVSPISNHDKENIPVESSSSSGKECTQDLQQAAETGISPVEERPRDRLPPLSVRNTRAVRHRYRSRHNYKY